MFKYNSLISVVLFGLIEIYLLSKTKGYSLKRDTVSETILFLKNPVDQTVFRLNFVLKSLLDLGFFWYILNFYAIPLTSLFAWSLIIMVVLWSTLAYFTVDKYRPIHKKITYIAGFIWTTAEIYLANLTQNSNLILFTYVIATIIIAISSINMLGKKTNIIIQTICMALMYVWLYIFVTNYL